MGKNISVEANKFFQFAKFGNRKPNVRRFLSVWECARTAGEAIPNCQNRPDRPRKSQARKMVPGYPAPPFSDRCCTWNPSTPTLDMVPPGHPLVVVGRSPRLPGFSSPAPPKHKSEESPKALHYQNPLLSRDLLFNSSHVGGQRFHHYCTGIHRLHVEGKRFSSAGCRPFEGPLRTVAKGGLWTNPSGTVYFGHSLRS